MLAVPISALSRPDNTALFEMSQRWRAVGDTVCNLTAPKLEPEISRSSDGRVTARPTGFYSSLRTNAYDFKTKTTVCMRFTTSDPKIVCLNFIRALRKATQKYIIY